MFKIGLCMYYFKRVFLLLNDNKNVARCRRCCCRLVHNEPLCVMPKNTIINTKNQLCNVDYCWFGKPEEIMCFSTAAPTFRFCSTHIDFSNFSCMFLNPNIFFSNLNSNCSNLSDMRNLQEQVKKAFCYQKLFWPFTVWINCSSDLKIFANSRPSALNFKSFSR